MQYGPVQQVSHYSIEWSVAHISPTAERDRQRGDHTWAYAQVLSTVKVCGMSSNVDTGCARLSAEPGRL
jgi:hypothetical protein